MSCKTRSPKERRVGEVAGHLTLLVTSQDANADPPVSAAPGIHRKQERGHPHVELQGTQSRRVSASNRSYNRWTALTRLAPLDARGQVIRQPAQSAHLPQGATLEATLVVCARAAASRADDRACRRLALWPTLAIGITSTAAAINPPIPQASVEECGGRRVRREGSLLGARAREARSPRAVGWGGPEVGDSVY